MCELWIPPQQNIHFDNSGSIVAPATNERVNIQNKFREEKNASWSKLTLRPILIKFIRRHPPQTNSLPRRSMRYDLFGEDVTAGCCKRRLVVCL